MERGPCVDGAPRNRGRWWLDAHRHGFKSTKCLAPSVSSYDCYTLCQRLQGCQERFVAAVQQRPKCRFGIVELRRGRTSSEKGRINKKERRSIRIMAFRSVPPFAQGVVRDFRVRWAVEEAGLPYEVRLLGQGDQKSESYRDLQPFGQVPSFEEGGLTLFESGAIVLHIAERSDALMPKDEEGRSRARTWVFAALNTVEPHIQELAGIDLFWPGQAWTKERRPMVEKMVRQRLGELADAMQGRDYLEEGFTAGAPKMSGGTR